MSNTTNNGTKILPPVATMQNFIDVQFEKKFKSYARAEFGLAGKELYEDVPVTRNDLGFPEPLKIVKVEYYDEEEMREYSEKQIQYEEYSKRRLGAQSDASGTKTPTRPTEPTMPKLKYKFGEFSKVQPELYQAMYKTAESLKREYDRDKMRLWGTLEMYLDDALQSAVKNHADYRNAQRANDTRRLMNIVKECATGEGTTTIYALASKFFGMIQTDATREGFYNYYDQYQKVVEEMKRASQNNPDKLLTALYNARFVAGLKKSMFKLTVEQMSRQKDWPDYQTLFNELATQLNNKHGVKGLFDFDENEEGIITVEAAKTKWHHPRTADNPVRTCFNCGMQTTHRSAECPKPPTKCGKCGKRGHKDEFCMLAQRGSVGTQMASDDDLRPETNRTNYRPNRPLSRNDRSRPNNKRLTKIRFTRTENSTGYADDKDDDARTHDDDDPLHETEDIVDEIDNDIYSYRIHMIENENNIQQSQDEIICSRKHLEIEHTKSVDTDNELLAVDTGCIGSGHVVRNKDLLSNINPGVTMKVQGYDGQSTTITTVGTVQGLGKAAHVPDAPNNLINVRKLCQEIGGNFKGDANSITIYDRNNKVYAIAKDHGDGFLSVPYKDIKTKHHVIISAMATNTQMPDSQGLTPEEELRAARAHKLCERLRHPGFKHIYQSLKEGAYHACEDLTHIDLLHAIKQYGPCLACLEGKMRAPPSNQPSTHPPARAVGEIVHIDLLSFPKDKTPIGGYTHILFTVDEKSAYTKLLPLKSKSDLFSAFKSLISHYISHGHKVSVIRSDDERAITTHKTALGLMGVRLETTPAGLHNRRCERYIQTHLRICKSIRAGLPYELPDDLLFELALAAEYAMNTSCNNTCRSKTPYQVFTGRKPYIPIYPFGQTGLFYSPRPEEDRTAEYGILLDFNPLSKNHRAYFPLRRGGIYSRRKFEPTNFYPREWGLHPRIRPPAPRRRAKQAPTATSNSLPISVPITEPMLDTQPRDIPSFLELTPTDKPTPTPGSSVRHPESSQSTPMTVTEASPSLTGGLPAQEGDSTDDFIGQGINTNQSSFNSTIEQANAPHFSYSDHAQLSNQEHDTIDLTPETIITGQGNNESAVATTRHSSKKTNKSVQQARDDSQQPRDNNSRRSQDQQQGNSPEQGELNARGLPKRRAAMQSWKDGPALDRPGIRTNSLKMDSNRQDNINLKVYRISLSEALRDAETQNITIEAARTEFINLLETQKALDPVIYKDIPKEDRGKIINGHIFFKDKIDHTGKPIRKGRFVLNGNEQNPDHIDMTHSPTVNPISLFLTLSVSAQRPEYTNDAYDVVGAFVCTEMPEGKVIIVRVRGKTKDLMLRLFPYLGKHVSHDDCLYFYLRKFLYGLAEAAREFHLKLIAILTSMGFKPTQADNCLLIKDTEDGRHFLSLHVDDIFSAAPNQSVREKFETELQRHLQIKKQYRSITYLGLEINKDTAGRITVSQQAFAESLMRRYDVKERIVNSPCRGDILSVSEIEKPQRALEGAKRGEYISMIMACMYLARLTRSDILFATSYLSTKCARPTEQDYQDARRLLRYIKGTISARLVFRPGERSSDLTFYCDASHLIHPDGYGHSGYMATISGVVIFARSTKQKLQGRSSAESELIATEECSTYVVYIRKLAMEMGIMHATHAATKVGQDNKSAIILANQGISFRRTRHMIGRINYLRERIQSGDLVLTYVPSEDLPADMLTKPLPSPAIRRIMTFLHVEM